MDFATFINSLVAGGPLAVMLGYWVWQERKERIETQKKLVAILEKQLPLVESARDIMREMRDIQRARGGATSSGRPPRERDRDRDRDRELDR